MDPEDSDIFGNLKKPLDKEPDLNLIKSLEDRCLGHLKKNVKAKEYREIYAEEEFIRKEKYEELRCEMPGIPRSTFLMVFSPDGTKVASTQGNHNIYVTDLRSGRNIKTLIGHPRTPWCIAFHPTSNQIIASGCLGGQVRIWDLSGGSEVWTASNQSVIASIAFHPNDRILVIATINEVHFWDWSEPKPFCHTATGNQKEKVRYVAFDKLGHKLITGISNSQNRWEYVRSSVPVTRQPERAPSPYRRRLTHRIYSFPTRHNTQPPPANNSPREPLSSVPERERNITMCYRNLVREYGRLVQRYLQLYRPPAMIDRGTDPMEENNTPSRSNGPQLPESPPDSSSSNSPTSNFSNPTTTSPSSPKLIAVNPLHTIIQRPNSLSRGSEAVESRKHKAESSSSQEQQSGGKKIKVNETPPETSSTNLVGASSASSIHSDPLQSSVSPQPSTSTCLGTNYNKKPETEQTLEDIIRSSSVFKVRNSLFDWSKPSCSKDNQANPPENLAPSLDSAVSTNQATSNRDPLPSESSSGSPTTSREASRNALMNFLNKLPKVSKSTQKSTKNKNSDSSRSDKSDEDSKQTNENASQTVAEIGTSNSALQAQSEENKNDQESTNVETRRPEDSEEVPVQATPVDCSEPGTSRAQTDEENRPKEAQKLELMMMNIRRNAEEKLRSRFLPLIRSVPENDRLELIRLFEQGVKKSREKARQRYRNMAQLFNKKPNRRPLLDTSSDTSSSDDEPDPLQTNIFSRSLNNTTLRYEENSSLPSTSTGIQRSQDGPESSSAYHDINNLENWVTSLFDDIDTQTTASTNDVTTSVTTQTASTNTASIGSLLDRPPPLVPRYNARRMYDRSTRDRRNSVDFPNTATTTSNSPTVTTSSPLISPGAVHAVTRTTNCTIYSFANHRRMSGRRSSAFLYHPRTPPELRRSNRQFSFGRWRRNPRLHSHNTRDRPITTPMVNNNSNFATDEVINFSELPNSEDDPILSTDARPSTPSPHYPLHFHPFNPPPDLPTINPENIGIGNMYSSIVQDLETSLNDVRNIRAANRPGEMSDMLSNLSERLENIMNQSETILRNLRTSVEMLPGNETSDNIPGGGTVPTVSFSDSSFYIRDNRTEGSELERNLDSMLDETLANNVTSDHTYPRNSDSSASPSTSSDTMSPLMTSLHLTIFHIQRQARLLRQQVESIERIDRAMVEVAQLQLMRLLLNELSRYVRNMSGESRSTCMSSVRQMMAGTRISDSSPNESASNDNDTVQPHHSGSQSQPNSATTSSDTNNTPTARTRGLTLKTYPPSRMSRLQRQHFLKSILLHHMPRRHALRVPSRNVPSILSPSASVHLDPQSNLNKIYSRINTFTLNRMSRRLDELINEQVRIFTQRSSGRCPPRIPGSAIGEQNLAMRLRDSISRTNNLVGSIFDANVVRNYRIGTAMVSRDGVDRFYARQTLSFIIDGISSHLQENRISPLPHNIRLQLQGVMTMSMLLSELLLLHIVDSIPPPTDMNLDQERQSLTNRIDQMCSTMMMSSRYGGYSTHLTHSLRQLQSMIRQNSSQPPNVSSERRRTLSGHNRAQDIRSRNLYRQHRLNALSRVRNALYSFNDRTRERSNVNQPSPDNDVQRSENGEGQQDEDRDAIANRIQAIRRMSSSLNSMNGRIEEQSDERESVARTRRNAQYDRERVLNARMLTRLRLSLRSAHGRIDCQLDEPQENDARPTEDGQDIRDRVLEARDRALSRMRNSLISLRYPPNDQSDNSQAYNSESDDSSRQNVIQVAGPSSEFGSLLGHSWSPIRPPANERRTDDTRDRNAWSNNVASSTPNGSPPDSSANRPVVQPTTSAAPPTSSVSEEWSTTSRWPWNVIPSVQVNDVPVSEFAPAQESSESDNPTNVTSSNNNNNNTFTNRGVWARMAAIRTVTNPLGVFRPRFLHPLYASVNPFDADLDDPHREHIYDSDVITTVTPNHRIQVWDMSESDIPVISNPLKNVVVGECKIHNDASVDIASDGSILVTLLPSGGYLNVTNRLGVYSLKWETLGQCLYTTNFDHNAVSVSLSPLSRHLVVGLASRRVSIVPSERWMMATIFKIEQKDIPGDRLPIVRKIDQSRDGRATSHKSVNCIRWLPTSGQGLIYATNTGQLVIWT